MKRPHPDTPEPHESPQRATWKVFLAALAAVTVFAGCRPGDTAAWVRMYEPHPRAALRHLREDHPRIWARGHPAPAPARWTPDTPCAQYAQTALDAGFTQAQWLEPVARIMYAESRCYPGAYNGASGVAGLMQIHPLWRADAECSGNLYDPLTNLRCARHVYAVQGWGAW